jgi:hypothetical protein
VTGRPTLYRKLGALGWERMTPAFAVPSSGPAEDFQGTGLSPSVAYGTRTTVRSSLGQREVTVRSLDLDFTLVGRLRLRRGGVDQRLYTLGPAIHGTVIEPDVLLAEGWIRTRHADPAPLLDVLDTWFQHVIHRVNPISAALIRLRVAAWTARDVA